METTIAGRGVTITDRFSAYVEEKLEKVGVLLQNSTGTAVRVSRHHDASGAAGGDRVEITVQIPGKVVRAESDGPDKYAAFDSAFHRIMERARRIKSRKTNFRSSERTPLRTAAESEFQNVGVQPAAVELIDQVAAGEVPDQTDAHDEDEQSWSPVVIRRKSFPTRSMTVSEAVDQMELVGHPFYLFYDSESERCAVVYRRKGWSYGVIALDDEIEEEQVESEQRESA
ncbi:ribosome hibernation-promoting factor, HPF/YfiA family [Humidisolicoccus flavus]|uniref:ribosome hibernation-promoting factor, HPF/YfiA family n=1 Tax=Humidisolicoccus flavus TaxID=3111414 RepID=UPI00324A7B18